jgi:Helix-turn-helix.
VSNTSQKPPRIAAGVEPSATGRVGRGGTPRRDRAFALRLQKACDDNPRVPAYNHGRQAWVRAQLVERYGVNVSNETVSKWFTGVSRPRPEKITTIAKLLEVDEAWLALGVQGEVEPRERRLRNAQADGAVNVVAGFIQMCGGHPAFPDDDGRGDLAPVDLYAIIKGAHYSINVAVAQPVDGGQYRCQVPHGYEQRIVIAIVQREPLVCDFLELPAEMITAHGARRSGYVEVTFAAGPKGYVTDGAVWPRIQTFAERL